MCGFVGFSIAEQSVTTREQLERMLSTIRYRGPDGEGYFVDDGIALGHVRLAIVDLAGGKQPFVEGGDYADQNYVDYNSSNRGIHHVNQGTNSDALVFNGEIYGYRTLAESLHRQGVALRDHSDTAVLCALLQRDGIEQTLNKIDGMFAFAYRPSHGAAGGELAENQPVYLARDRFGEKPLYYSVKKGQLIFASEVKAILQHTDCADSRMDRLAISEFLTTEYLLGESTGFEGIKKLLPGHYLKFQAGQVTVKRYFNPSSVSCSSGELELISPSMSQQQRLLLLEEQFNQSIEKQLVADVPVGLFLSGGLDSSLIAAFAKQQHQSVTAYSIKMPEGSFDEAPYASQVASHLKLDHCVIEANESDVLSSFYQIGKQLDQPFADSSMIPSYLVSQKTRNSVKVALGGDGADELFAGYINFKLNKFANIIRYIPASLGTALRQSLRLLPANSGYMSTAFLLQQLSYGFGKNSHFQSLHFMSALSVREQASLWKKGVLSVKPVQQLHNTISSLVAQKGDTHLTERLQHLFYATYLPDDILFKVDRASMYNSLEVRAPFLCKNFAQLALSLSAEDKLQGFTTKYLLKKMAEKHLPENIIYRKKHGFALPISQLLRNMLKGPVHEVISDRQNPLYEWLHYHQVMQLWKWHQSGKRDYGKKLWALYSLLRWSKQYGRL